MSATVTPHDIHRSLMAAEGAKQPERSDQPAHSPPLGSVETEDSNENALIRRIRNIKDYKLIAYKTAASLIAITAFNLAIIKPSISGLTWAGILLGNAVSFIPREPTKKTYFANLAVVVIGGAASFLPEYFLQNKIPLLGQFLTSAVFTASINAIWLRAMKGLDPSFHGKKRAIISSIGAVGGYKLVHAYLGQPWANFLGSTTVIGFNMLAFPPPRHRPDNSDNLTQSENDNLSLSEKTLPLPPEKNGLPRPSKYQMLMLALSILPLAGAALCDKYSGNEKANNAAAFIGNTIALSIAWYQGQLGLDQQRNEAGKELERIVVSSADIGDSKERGLPHDV